MAKVLVVCKTRMNQRLCLGGLTLDDRQKIRLLTANGQNQPTDTLFQVGEVWECLLDPVRDAQKPQTEDTRVLRQRRLRDPKAFLLEILKQVPTGWLELFEGTLQLSPSGSSFVCERTSLPSYAHEFWRPELPLRPQTDRGRVYYVVEGARSRVRMRYSGLATAPNFIPPGSLLHLSLARPWKPPDARMEVRCYLLISAIYL